MNVPDTALGSVWGITVSVPGELKYRPGGSVGPLELAERTSS